MDVEDQSARAELGFADIPELELEQLLIQLMGRAQDVLSAQGRLRGLLRATTAVARDLDLDGALRRVVEAACELVGARYGALGVIGQDGHLDQFIHVGIDADSVAKIGHLPEGHGLLGAVIADPRPIRIGSIADDPRAVGFPANHPAMGAFLGVPIMIRGAAYGNLYLTEPLRGQFAAEDEDLVTALAASAAVAIDNARLYAEGTRRQDWLAASTEITQQLLSASGEAPLSVVARRVLQMADADVVTVLLPTGGGDQLMVEAAAGDGADELAAVTYPSRSTLSARSIAARAPITIPDIAAETTEYADLAQSSTIGPAMAIPLAGSAGTRGALFVGRRRGRPHFSEADVEMAATFADHAAVALELSDARTDQQRLALLEDRDRIARDLHDHVIQRLFAAGLTAQRVASALGDAPEAELLEGVIDEMDATIRQIRTTIFRLRGPLDSRPASLRDELLSIIDASAAALGFAPSLRLGGALDTAVPALAADDAVAVVREGLSNVTQHAGATATAVEISVSGDTLVVQVTDNGVGGAVDPSHRSGLANLQDRARRQGGSMTVAAAAGGGTVLRWSIPLT